MVPHGGGDGLYPENTMLAYDRTMAAGADVVDVDVRSTADGVLVAFHDATLARTGPTEELDEAIWMLEEVRISSFAQSVGVKGSVSEKRIRSVLGRSA